MNDLAAGETETDPFDPARAGGVDALLAVILETTPQPVWVVAHDGTVLYSNSAALHTLGYTSADEVLGRDSHTLVHATHPDGTPYPASECPMLTPVHTGLPARGDEEWFTRADGSYFPIAWSSAPIQLPSGPGAVLSCVDLTSRFELERQLREREVAEARQAELKEAHLRLMADVAEARRQLARDLHDGAQQRLVALALEARLLRESLVDAPPDALSLLDGVMADAQGAIDELRALSSGIHPSVLTSRGLLAAVNAQAARCPTPVMVGGGIGDRRFAELIESNAYFFVAEALTNAAKYARASRIDVELDFVAADAASGDASGAAALHVTIRDDGIGGVSLERAGSGLHSMHDRVRAFEGEVLIESPAGGGTVIRARIPLAEAAEPADPISSPPLA